MGALEHSSNVIWHAASAQSLEAKILCTLLNVHKLVSLLRITPTGKSCWWWAFSYCLQTTLASESNWTASHIDLTCLCTCISLTQTTYCVTATGAYVFLCVMWNDNGPVGVLPLAVELHFMNAQWISFIKKFFFKIGPRTNIQRQYRADENSFLCCQGRHYTLCGWHIYSDALPLSLRRSCCLCCDQ